MMHINRTVILLLLAALVLSACQPIQAPVQVESTASEEPHGLRFDAPEYAIDGPYGVGVRYFEIPGAGEEDRDLTVSVWYPAATGDEPSARIEYEQNFRPGEIPSFSVFGNAILDAPPDHSGAPYPVVVYSHATWAFGQEVPYFTEHLASRGFVVISTDHEDNWSTAFSYARGQAMVNRPKEVTREIDFAESLAAPNGDLPGMVDVANVGAAGWSMGGETALAVAGGTWDLESLRAWCATEPEQSVEDCIEEFTSAAGLDQTPQGLWPSMLDERVRAVVSLAGYTSPFGEGGLSSVKVPVMFTVGSGAVAADSTFEVDAPYETVGSERKAKAVFGDGEALMFFSSCADTPSIVELGFPMFCSDPVWDMDRAHDLINHFATAFLLAELKGDTMAAAALAPQNVDFPGIEYQAEGYEAVPSEAAAASLDPTLTAKINEYVAASIEKDGVPGLAVGIVKDGELVYAKGFGVQNLETGEAVTPETLFLGAELTFAPTTLAVLKLAEEGKLDLDAPISEYLPNFRMMNGDSSKITARQILSHQSGIPDSGDQMADWANLTPAFDEAATEEWVRSLAERDLSFEPGTSFEYSDLAFAVLGAVVSAVTGQPFEQYVSENVFAPLGMEQSTLLLDEVDPALLASPHVADGAGGRQVSENFPWHRPFAGANNLITNVNDLSKLAAALLHDGKVGETAVIAPESIDNMWTSLGPTPFADFLFGVETPSGLMQEYGQGWFIGDIGGEPVYDAFGNEAGFTNLMVVAPAAGVAVIALGNGSVLEEYYAANIATDVMGMVLEGSK